MFKKVLLYSAVGTVLAVNPISAAGCQCTSACQNCGSAGGGTACLSGKASKNWCKVEVSSCTGLGWSDKGLDDCGNLLDSITDSLSGWFGSVDLTKIQDLGNKMHGWAKETIDQIDWNKIGMDKIAEIDFSQITGKLDTTKLEEIKAKLEALKASDVAAWTQTQWEKVPIDNIMSMGWEALQQVPVSEVGKWTQEQWNKFPVDKLVKLTGDQIAKLDSSKLSKLGDEYWDKFPTYQIVHFSVELLQSADFLSHLNATHIAHMSSEQWKSFPVDSVSKFTLDKLQAIDYDALGGWTKEMWDKMPIDTLAKFANKQIESIPADTVGAWTKDQWLKFDASAAVMFTTDQLKAGAAVLKDMTEEELAKYDWSQIKADAMAELPQELQDKIKELATKAKPVIKDLVDKVDAAWKVKEAKYKAMMEASDADKAVKEAEYKTADASYQQLAQQLSVETNNVNGVAESPAFRVAGSAVAATLLAAALSM